jgi:hypothetical protein
MHVLNSFPSAVQDLIRGWHSRGWTPMRRLATPDDIGDTVTLFCSEKARWITGQVIAADGRQVAQKNNGHRDRKGSTRTVVVAEKFETACVSDVPYCSTPAFLKSPAFTTTSVLGSRCFRKAAVTCSAVSADTLASIASSNFNVRSKRDRAAISPAKAPS